LEYLYTNTKGEKEMQHFVLSYLQQYFDEVEPLDFYRAIFPLGALETAGEQQKGKYNAVAVELLPQGEETAVKRHLIHDDLNGIKQLLQSDNFIIISPISYAGKSRVSANARYIYAMAIDLDGITKEEHLRDLFHQFKNEVIPKPTYIIFSGSGLHLYYHFAEPLPCFDNIKRQLAALKKNLTWKIWNKYTTELFNNIQYESLFQGFRMVGGITKSGSRTRAFEIGDKVTIDYLNSFVEDKYKVKEYTYKSKLTLAEAAEKYPKWYNDRIINKKPKGSWQTKKDLFYWWIKKIKEGAKVGHRYYCVMCLAIYAKKSGISKEELEAAAFDLVEFLDNKSESEDNRFTRADILAALEMYNDSYIRFSINSISTLTDIEIEKNKRNYRKQNLHLEIARATKFILSKSDDKYKGGRKPKGNIIAEWRQQNPDGTKAQCIKDTGLSKPTVYKYWS
jgi:hypothetical protein